MKFIRYRVVGPPNYSVTDLKTLEDWVLERRFKAVPGVIDVTGWGGKTKTYEIAIDQHKLVGNGLSVPQVLAALGNANINVGGQTVDFGAQAAVVRGVGLIHSADEIRHTLITNNQGAPVVIGDVAEVTIGHLPRLGIAGYNDVDDIVQGIVLMRRGAESVPTIKRVEAEVDNINKSGILPPGVSIQRIYDRSDLINITTRTVLHNMVAGIVLIFLLQWAFLGNLRSAVIVAMTIPFALSFAIGLMVLRGESANLLSVGAIDFGLVVDATVIMVENIFRHLAEASAHLGTGPSHLHRMRVPSGFRGKMGTISLAAAEVSQSIFFAAAIIIAGFVPLFTLSGIEGHIFGPMAKTYAYAIAGGLIATFTIAPALSLLLFPQVVSERETPVVRALRRAYQPALEFVLANRIITFSSLAVIALAAIFAVRSLGLEFLPKLEEGNLWIRATFPQSVSLEDSDTYVNRMRALMRKYPEVETVVSQHGRPDDGTDATGFFNAEFFVPLKPFDTWPAGMDKEKLTQRMTEELQQQFPGVDFNFSQYIQDNVEEAASGVKGENSVKVYGNDLETLEKTANAIAAVLAHVPGITDLAVFRSLGQPTIRIDVDRVRAARYGLAPGDVNAVVQTAIGGQSAGDLYEGTSDRHFPMMVRLAAPYRQSLNSIRRIPIAAPASRRQRRHPGAARGCRRRAFGFRRGVHLSRAAAALCAHQVQRARPRSRRRRARGAERRQRPGASAGRLPPRMGGRIRQFAGGDRALDSRRAVVDRVDRSASVPEFRQFARRPVGRERDPDGAARRNFRALGDRYGLQRVLRHRVRRAIWDCGDGRHSGGVVLPPESGIGPRSRQRHAANLPHATPAGDDDLHGGLRGLGTRGLFDRHRFPGPAAARAGGGRRHAAGAVPDTSGAAGADHEILDGTGIAGGVTAGSGRMRAWRRMAVYGAAAALSAGGVRRTGFSSPRAAQCPALHRGTSRARHRVRARRGRCGAALPGAARCGEELVDAVRVRAAR